MQQKVIRISDVEYKENSSFCDIFLYHMSKQGERGLLYRDICFQVVRQILIFLDAGTEKLDSYCPSYPVMMYHLPEKFVLLDSLGQPTDSNRQKIYEVLLEKNAEFIFELPDEQTRADRGTVHKFSELVNNIISSPS